MKYMIISDIHGGIYELNKVLDIYNKEHCSQLIILGDLFNYGFDLNREDIVNRLNLMNENIIAVRGKCDNNINDIKQILNALLCKSMAKAKKCLQRKNICLFN